MESSGVDLLAARFRIGPGIIERVAAEATSRPPHENLVAELDQSLRQYLDTQLSHVAQRIDRLASWDSLVLPADAEDSLRELISRVRNRRTVYERWGFERDGSGPSGVVALFQGGPGTGKTMVAGVLARELGLDLYRIDLSKIVSKWIGETEQNLAAVFDAAEDGQVVLLFDEADSLFARRTEVRTSVDRYANLEVNYLLQRLDQFDGFAILTTNLSGSIDKAFMRRFSFRIQFPFPELHMRVRLWKAHLPAGLPVAGVLDFDTLARRYELSGGNIKNAVLRAAFLAAGDDKPLTQEHLERAIALEYRETGKLVPSGTLG